MNYSNIDEKNFKNNNKLYKIFKKYILKNNNKLLDLNFTTYKHSKYHYTNAF